MSSRWEKGVFDQVVHNLDPTAARGTAIGTLKLDPKIFAGKPESHSDPACSEFLSAYALFVKVAIDAKRLPRGGPLVKRWNLGYDIYSPCLGRFIEVDEYQHFSQARLDRLVTNRNASWSSLYANYFWDSVLPTLVAKPYHDPSPPHRDEQRAYRDEMRERLPILYGLQHTIRLDEFTLREIGLENVVDLINEIVVRGKA